MSGGYSIVSRIVKVNEECNTGMIYAYDDILGKDKNDNHKEKYKTLLDTLVRR
jgi:hypothetical protein